MKQNNVISTQLLDDTRQIIEAAQETAYRLADLTLVRRNWLLGQRIAQEELGGADRADYGTYIINGLSRELTARYGKGFTRTNLYTFIQFYKAFPEIVHTVSGQSTEKGKQIVHAVSGQSQKLDSSEIETIKTNAYFPKIFDKLSWSRRQIGKHFYGDKWGGFSYSTSLSPTAQALFFNFQLSIFNSIMLEMWILGRFFAASV